MLLQNYQFRFSLLYTMMAIVAIGLFATLGTWQTSRAFEKQHLQDEIDKKNSQTGFLMDHKIESLAEKKYLRVEAIGHYDTENEILIDNTVHNGKAGYYVMTPFILKADKTVIMVNRGWVPVGNDRNVLPELSAPTEELHIKGTISPPKSKPPLILAELDTSKKMWLYFDSEKYAEHRHNNLITAVIILLDKDEKHGYIREWPKYDTKVGMHIGYAIQWYVFALIVLVTYIFLNFKKRETSNSESGN